MQELLLGHLSHWMQTLLSLSTEQRLSRHTRTAQYAGRLWAHADTASHKAGYTLRLSGAREAHVSAGRSRPRPDDRTGTHTLHTSTRVWPKPPHQPTMPHCRARVLVASRPMCVTRPSPQRPRPPPTGEDQCTFSPRVNRTPRSLSSSVSQYLDDPAHLRLSHYPNCRGTPSSAPSSPRVLTHSASAPRRATPQSERTAAAAPPNRPAVSTPVGLRGRRAIQSRGHRRVACGKGKVRTIGVCAWEKSHLGRSGSQRAHRDQIYETIATKWGLRAARAWKFTKPSSLRRKTERLIASTAALARCRRRCFAMRALAERTGSAPSAAAARLSALARFELVSI